MAHLLLLLKLLHLTTVVAFLAGIVGRAVTFSHASRAATFPAAAGLLAASEIFDRWLVIPGSLLVLLTGGAAAGVGHWSFRTPEGSPTWLLTAVILYLSLIPLVAIVLAPRRRRRESALQAAFQAGEMTPELRAALADPAVRWSRRYEWLVVVAVFVLMVLKPF